MLLALLVAAACSGCGGATTPKGHTVTFAGGDSFPPATIVGSYSVRGCKRDAGIVVDDARAFYVHSTSGPGPADLYYFDMRSDYAHFDADGCTSKQLGQALKHGLNSRQLEFLLQNVASDLHHTFQAALDATR